MNYDGILFDLDGTLWNATRNIAESWRIALQDETDIEHIPTLAEFEGVMGMTAENLTATLFPYLSAERGAELFVKASEVENSYLAEHGGVLYSGIEEMLEKLSAQLPLFIVSNCNDGYIECFLKAHGTEKYFKDWECIGRTGKLKCDNIKLVVERNGLKRPVYVGDTQLDCESAGLAGVPFIHAAYGFGKVSGTEKINAPLELLKLV